MSIASPQDRSVSHRVPSYRRHKPSGQAVVTISGRDIYLGKWNTAASRAEYDRLIGEWLAGGRCLRNALGDRRHRGHEGLDTDAVIAQVLAAVPVP